MTEKRFAYKNGRTQSDGQSRGRKNRVEAAIEAARQAFTEKEPGCECEVEKLEHLSVGPDCTCDTESSWLAIYRLTANKPLKAIFLCDTCKDEVRKLLRYGYNDHNSFVLVKDWRPAEARSDNAPCSK